MSNGHTPLAQLMCECEQLRRENKILREALEEIQEFVNRLESQKRDTSSANHCGSIADDALQRRICQT